PCAAGVEASKLGSPLLRSLQRAQPVIFNGPDNFITSRPIFCSFSARALYAAAIDERTLEMCPRQGALGRTENERVRGAFQFVTGGEEAAHHPNPLQEIVP